MSKTYTVEEAAEYCKCHAETIRQYIRKGMLEASRPGRRCRRRPRGRLL